MKTTTKSGLEVTLTAKLDQFGDAAVEAEFDHPQAGRIKTNVTWSQRPVKDGLHGAVGTCSKGSIALLIPEEDYYTCLNEAKGIVEKEIDDIRTGKTPIELYWRDGSPLSGYAIKTRRASDMLCEIGIARPISGWGVIVDNKAVDALGESFTYADAMAYTQPKRDAEQSKLKAEEERREAKIEEAREAGKPVELHRYTEPCDGSACECSLDIISEMIDSDGNITVNRTHTH